MDTQYLGTHLKKIRQDRGISLRQLSRSAAMSPASLSAIENGRSSPTLATLSRVLQALGTGFSEFFAQGPSADDLPVFRAKDMRIIRDLHRRYTLAFPKRKGLKFEIVHEVLDPETRSEWETHNFDIGGLVLKGGPLRMEVSAQGQWELEAGDAFYVPAGQKHRVTNISMRRLTQVTVAYPPRY